MNNDNGSIFGAKKRVSDFFMQNKLEIDYKDVENLKKFISPEGKILPSRRSGLMAHNQRAVSRAIKRSRQAGLLPFRVVES